MRSSGSALNTPYRAGCTRHRARNGGASVTRARGTGRLRKQRPHAPQRHAAHVGVARVVDREVVPQHRAARPHPAPHRVGQALLEGVVEQRREDGGDEDDVQRRRPTAACSASPSISASPRAARGAPARSAPAAVRCRSGAPARNPGAAVRADCRRCRSRPRAGAAPTSRQPGAREQASSARWRSCTDCQTSGRSML